MPCYVSLCFAVVFRAFLIMCFPTLPVTGDQFRVTCHRLRFRMYAVLHYAVLCFVMFCCCFPCFLDHVLPDPAGDRRPTLRYVLLHLAMPCYVSLCFPVVFRAFFIMCFPTLPVTGDQFRVTCHRLRFGMYAALRYAVLCFVIVCSCFSCFLDHVLPDPAGDR